MFFSRTVFQAYPVNVKDRKQESQLVFPVSCPVELRKMPHRGFTLAIEGTSMVLRAQVGSLRQIGVS